MSLLDLPDVMELERASFSSPWSERMFRDELDNEYSHTLLARDEEGRLAGFICFIIVLDEMQIMNLAVREDLRGGGLGKALARKVIRFGRDRGVRSATLEVRQSNKAAISLYTGLGFEVAGLRRGYYEKPRENAVIMWLYNIDKPGAKRP